MQGTSYSAELFARILDLQLFSLLATWKLKYENCLWSVNRCSKPAAAITQFDEQHMARDLREPYRNGCAIWR